MSELAAAGVKRISLATTLYRAAMTGLLDAAREVKDRGQFGSSTEASQLTTDQTYANLTTIREVHTLLDPARWIVGEFKTFTAE